MPDDLWRMPRGWPFDAVELAPAGLLLHRGRRAPQSLPWRLVRAIQRPGDGEARLVLGNGDTLRLPDRSDADGQWLATVARSAEAAATRPPCERDYEEVARAFVDRYGEWHRVRSESRSLGYGVVYPVAISAMGLDAARSGSTWAAGFFLLVAAATGWLMYLFWSMRPSELRRYRIMGAHLELGDSYREKWVVPLASLLVRRHRRGLSVMVGGSRWLTACPSRAADALRALADAVEAVRSGEFNGADGTPPTAASLSRLTGAGAALDSRGLSRMGGDDDA